MSADGTTALQPRQQSKILSPKRRRRRRRRETEGQSGEFGAAWGRPFFGVLLGVRWASRDSSLNKLEKQKPQTLRVYEGGGEEALGELARGSEGITGVLSCERAQGAFQVKTGSPAWGRGMTEDREGEDRREGPSLCPASGTGLSLYLQPSRYMCLLELTVLGMKPGASQREELSTQGAPYPLL